MAPLLHRAAITRSLAVLRAKATKSLSGVMLQFLSFLFIPYIACIGHIPLGPVPRNFLVANGTSKLETCYKQVGRVANLLRGREEVTRNWFQWNLALSNAQFTPTTPTRRNCVEFRHVRRCELNRRQSAAILNSLNNKTVKK